VIGKDDIDLTGYYSIENVEHRIGGWRYEFTARSSTYVQAVKVEHDHESITVSMRDGRHILVDLSQTRRRRFPP
jgi:hypothetical protein